jgi:hypothetical protein
MDIYVTGSRGPQTSFPRKGVVKEIDSETFLMDCDTVPSVLKLSVPTRNRERTGSARKPEENPHGHDIQNTCFVVSDLADSNECPWWSDDHSVPKEQMKEVR